MSVGSKEEYIRYRLEKAREALTAAEILQNNEQWNATVNRLYYAAYYAVSALLIQQGIEAKTHSGVKTQFFQNFIKNEKIESEVGKIYADLFDWRQHGDYGDFIDFDKTSVEMVYEPTRQLVKIVANQIEDGF